MQASRIQLLLSMRNSKGVIFLPYITYEHPLLQDCRFSTSGNSDTVDNTDNNSNTVDENGIKIPPPPTNCCMSGCQNCVWLTYAEELRKTICSSPEEHMEIILGQITDPNMKAFLKFELSHMKGECQYRPNCPVDPEDV